MKYFSIKLILSIVSSYWFFNQSIILAQSVELAWSPSDVNNLSHYNIYQSDFNLSDFIFLGWAGEKDSTFVDDAVKREIPYFYAATVVLQDGRESVLSNIVEVVLPDEAKSIVKLTMDQNFPNPFNPTTNINFSLSRPQGVNMKVYDITGREIMILMDHYLHAGEHSIIFDGSNLSNGVYFINIETGGISKTIKTLLLK